MQFSRFWSGLRVQQSLGALTVLILSFLWAFSSSGDGGKRTRTADSLRARQVLYQLSYTPLMGYPGLEPGTSPLSGVRSNQLS